MPESTASIAEYWTTESCKERWIELVRHLVSKNLSYGAFQRAVSQILWLFLSMQTSGLSVSMEAFLAGGSIDCRLPLILARGSCRNSDLAIEDSIGEVEDYIGRCVFVAMTCKGVSRAGA